MHRPGEAACLLCGSESIESQRNFDTFGLSIRCDWCGAYSLTDQALDQVNDWPPERRARLAAASYRSNEQGQMLELTTANLERIEGSIRPPSTPMVAMEEIVLFVASNGSTFGEWVTVPERLFPAFKLREPQELGFLLRTLVDQDWLEHEGVMGSRNYRLTVSGWERVTRLRSEGPRSQRVFVAMWFHEDTAEAWTHGLKPGIEDSGYEPTRVDQIPHNDRIDDLIIAEIRRSAFLVADFTGQRGGVYFEAGFGLGLGLPVIWTCREDELEKVHFDTRQYNFVNWADPEDLRVRLRNRIGATIGLRT